VISTTGREKSGRGRRRQARSPTRHSRVSAQRHRGVLVATVAPTTQTHSVGYTAWQVHAESDTSRASRQTPALVLYRRDCFLEVGRPTLTRNLRYPLRLHVHGLSRRRHCPGVLLDSRSRVTPVLSDKVPTPNHDELVSFVTPVSATAVLIMVGTFGVLTDEESRHGSEGL